MDEITVKQSWDAVDCDFNEKSPLKSTYTIYYIVSGSEDENAIIEAVKTDEAVPEEYNGVPRQTITISDRLTVDDWKVEVNYSRGDNNSSFGDDDDEPTFEFDISTTIKKIVFPVAHKGTYPSTASIPKAGINDGEGVDIIMPCHRFSETHIMSNTQCSSYTYRRTVAMLTGTINNNAFRNYPKGHVLFLGASGSRVGDEDWQITFKFAAAFPEENITIGDISGIRKDPWDVIWCQYTENESEDKSEIIRKVKAVHVDQVYKFANWGPLNL